MTEQIEHLSRDPDSERGTSVGPRMETQSSIEKYDDHEKGKDVENGVRTHVDDADEDENAAMLKAVANGDPFPAIPGAPEETQFTLRSMIVGCICGGLITASNLYLGLKSGNSITGGLFGALVGFAAVGVLAKTLPVISGSEVDGFEGRVTMGIRLKRFFKLGGYFGPRENAAIMGCATAASSGTVLFYTAVPALFQLKLVPGTVHAEFGKIVALSAVCNYWGMFFAVPFRRLYIIDQALPFPGAVASSILVRTLHTAKGSADNKRRMRGLMIAFGGSLVWKVVTEYCPGILQNWHVFWALYRAGSTAAVQGDNWGWYITWSPSFIGIGMVIGTNASISILGGQVLAWGIIGPALVAAGAAIGTPVPGFPHYISYQGATPPIGPQPCSPRYWVIWGAIFMMMVVTFTEIGCTGKEIYVSIRKVIKGLLRMDTSKDRDSVKQDPAPPDQRIPWHTWLTGSVIIGIFTAAVLSAQFDQSVTTSVVIIIVTLAFSFITCETVGRLAISGIATGLTQLLFIAYSTGSHQSVAMSAYSNILASAVSLSAGQQVGDLVDDLKSVHLLGASPRQQFWAQAFGAIVATLMTPALFLLFVDVYPCILSVDPAVTATCSFQVPQAVLYRAFAGLASLKVNIPNGAIIFAVVISVFGFFYTIARHLLWIPKGFHPYLPSLIAVGCGLVLPNGSIGIAFALGGVINWAWKRWSPAGATLFIFPVAAGMIAGEGIGGVITAILQIAKVGGDTHGSIVGCPWGIYCG